jgi:hypothetical protein
LALILAEVFLDSSMLIMYTYSGGYLTLEVYNEKDMER